MKIAKLTGNLTQHWINLPIRVRGTIIVAIPVVCLLTAISAFAGLKASLVEDETWVQHTQTVRLETKRLLKALVDAETGVRGYGLTRRDEFLMPYQQAQLVIPLSLQRLETLVQDNPQQLQQLATIERLVDENLALFERKILLTSDLKRSTQESDRVSAAILYDWWEQGKATMDRTRQELDRFAKTEEELLRQRLEHRDFYRQVTWVVLCTFGAIALLSAAIAIHLFYQLETELSKREVNLREANQRLEVVCEQLQRFTANASHELRTPLAGVLSNAQVGLMVLEEPEESSEELQKRFENIVTLTKEMSRLVSDLLFLARHEGLLSSEQLKTIDLTSLVQALANEWEKTAQDYGLRLIRDCPQEKVTVNGDQNLLRSAIANLLSNACRYTKAGGTIRLGLQLNRETLCVEVSDTGIGISPTAVPHIFERFYRSHSQQKPGFGLGLAIAQHIVQIHGGTINVSSTVGEGSTFQIILPKCSIS
jgi:signal transduction histidine kinase